MADKTNGKLTRRDFNLLTISFFGSSAFLMSGCGGQGGGGAVGASNLQLLEQISLQFDTPCAVLEMAAADQESVFDTFAERGNLGGMQIGAMGCQLRRDEEQQTGAIGGDDGEYEELSGLVGFEADQRLDGYLRLQREVPDLTRDASTAGYVGRR